MAIKSREINVSSYRAGKYKVTIYNHIGEGLLNKHQSPRYFNSDSTASNKSRAVRYANRKKQEFEENGDVVEKSGIPYWTRNTCIHQERLDPDERDENVCRECNVPVQPPGVDEE